VIGAENKRKRGKRRLLTEYGISKTLLFKGEKLRTTTVPTKEGKRKEHH